MDSPALQPDLAGIQPITSLRVGSGAGCTLTLRGACARRRVQWSVAAGWVVAAAITGPQSDQDAAFPIIGNPTVEAGDKPGCELSPGISQILKC